MFILIGLLVVMYFGAQNIINKTEYRGGVWTVGVFTAFLTLSLELFKKTCRASILINMVEKASISFDRLKKYLIIDPETKINHKLKKGDLKVENLTISLGDKVLINNLSFEAHKGEIIGIT
jgi:ATP-binding cassette subfamily B multidrug efflux pump